MQIYNIFVSLFDVFFISCHVFHMIFHGSNIHQQKYIARKPKL